MSIDFISLLLNVGIGIITLIVVILTYLISRDIYNSERKMIVKKNIILFNEILGYSIGYPNGQIDKYKNELDIKSHLLKNKELVRIKHGYDIIQKLSPLLVENQTISEAQEASRLKNDLKKIIHLLKK